MKIELVTNVDGDGAEEGRKRQSPDYCVDSPNSTGAAPLDSWGTDSNRVRNTNDVVVQDWRDIETD